MGSHAVVVMDSATPTVAGRPPDTPASVGRDLPREELEVRTLHRLKLIPGVSLPLFARVNAPLGARYYFEQRYWTYSLRVEQKSFVKYEAEKRYPRRGFAAVQSRGARLLPSCARRATRREAAGHVLEHGAYRLADDEALDGQERRLAETHNTMAIVFGTSACLHYRWR